MLPNPCVFEPCARAIFAAFLLALGLLLAAPGDADALPFADLAGHWARDVITEMQAMDLVRGDGDGRVRPDDPITREECVVLLLRALDIAPETVSTASFVDVEPSRWSHAAIEKAVALGLVYGVDATRFRPRDPVTREQLAALLVRAGEALVEARSGAPRFGDVPPERWSATYIRDAWRFGLINGVTDRLFEPARPATRAETFVVVRRFLAGETKESFLPDPSAVAEAVYAFEESLAAAVNQGPPHRWSAPYDYVVGAARGALAEMERAYRNAAEAGAAVSILNHELQARVTGLSRHLATVEATRTQTVSLSGPGLEPVTETRTRKATYTLRLVEGRWRIYGFGYTEA
ncbi:MAG: S-layer homology domain-containing protein [Firmicutes bacterium]|nr:S-layer homology domain-containing protein [Bacillota bacterium]